MPFRDALSRVLRLTGWVNAGALRALARQAVTSVAWEGPGTRFAALTVGSRGFVNRQTLAASAAPMAVVATVVAVLPRPAAGPPSNSALVIPGITIGMGRIRARRSCEIAFVVGEIAAERLTQ